jgi:glyoxylase-like metal-dependent hydrolase (beta-lactamase superfamily II)
MTSTEPPCYEVFALRFATLAVATQDQFLMKTDPHDGPTALDFFIWVVRGEGQCIVFDMGFGQRSSVARNRKLIHHPVDALKALGINAADVPHVVISHLHYDHSGNAEFFSKATFHVQDDEVKFATGRYMCHRALSGAFDVENVTDLVQNVFKGRVRFHDGDDELAPGISLHRIGGHTGGMQVLRVHTARGWVVLASDAAHFYRNLLTDNPFPIVLHIGDVLEGNKRLIALADSKQHVVPGHDPQVLQIYPLLPNSEVQIACLHLPPLADARP